jgi:hypothetical protein
VTPSSLANAWFTKEAAGTITLAWADNSANEDGFGIERKTGTNGTFTQIATVAANVNSYSDSGIVAGNTYCYRVNAFNSAGASSCTNEACKTMPALTPTFDFSMANGDDKSITQGQSVTNTITATLSSGSSQSVSFSTSGLPSGATASYTTSNFCTPTCSRTLNIATAASTPAGIYTITVTGMGGGLTKTTKLQPERESYNCYDCGDTDDQSCRWQFYRFCFCDTTDCNHRCVYSLHNGRLSTNAIFDVIYGTDYTHE